MPISKPKGKFRSTFEWSIAQLLKKLKVPVKYETDKLKYTVPEREATYTPDFKLPNGIYIECKGRFTGADRKKMILVIKSNPDKDIRMVFQNARVRLSKVSKTTYGEWATKNGIIWAEKTVPKEWLR